MNKLPEMIGQPVLGYWGAMHPYNEGVIVGEDEKFLHIQWNESEFMPTDEVQLVPHAEMSGEWYLDVSRFGPKIGIYYANMSDAYIDAGIDFDCDAETLAL